MAKKRKKKKLRKPVKASLYLLLGTTIQPTLSKTILPTLFGNPVITVNAETNFNQTVKTIATIKNDDLSDKKTLKNYVVNQYSVMKDEKLDTDKTTVIMNVPTVVTAPTISNVDFTVITEDEKKELPTAILAAQMQSQVDASNKKTTSDEILNSSPEPIAGTEDENKNSNSSKSENSVETVAKETIASVKTDEPDKEKNTENASETAVSEIQPPTKLENDLTVSTDKPIVVDDKCDMFNLDIETQKDNSTTENGLNITLKTNYVLINDGSEFNPSDYIEKMTAKNGTLPVLKVDNPVNSNKSGEYTVTYTVVDLNGKTASAQLKVGIDLTEKIMEQREQDTKDQIQKFVDETVGKSFDEDGYYNDQCWDLWAHFNRTHSLLGFDYSTQPYGYVYGIPLKFNKSGASTYYDYIQPDAELKPGDWLFWDKGSSCPDSHVAMLLSVNADGTLKCLTQTEGEGTTIKDIQPDIMAAFRLKPAYAWYTFKNSN